MTKIKPRPKFMQTSNVKRYVFNVYKYYWLILIFAGLFLLVSLFLCNKFGFNKGVDFAGGVVVETTCDGCKPADITTALNKEFKTSVISQQTGGGALYKMPVAGDYETMITKFKKICQDNNAKVASIDYVSPEMTKTFMNESIFACAFAFICIGLYVVVRFNLKFAISAILSLIFDVLLVIAFVSYTQIEMCLITLTAILTIIGYCINDKIVIFDRIRSNLDLITSPMAEIIKNSIRAVLFRSIFTSLTTIITTLSLLFFGDRFIFDFGLTMMFGIFVGTISSIFLAPSLLLAFRLKHKKNTPQTKDPMWYAS